MKKQVKFLLSIFFSVGVLYFLFKDIDIERVKNQFYFDWKIFIVVILFFFLTKLVNTYRFSVAYQSKITSSLFYVLCYCNMMLSIFPFRLGELTYVSKLSLLFKKGHSEVASTLIRIRLFDYISIYILLMLSSIYVFREFSEVIKIVSLFFILSLIIGLLTVFLILKFGLSERVKIKKINALLKIIEKEMKNHWKLDFLDFKMMVISILYWLARLFMGYFILSFLGIELSIFTVAFISLAVFMLSLIPIQFFAGFGITEAGFMFFLKQLGFDYDSTISKLFLYHLYLLIPVVLYGLVGFIGTKYSRHTSLYSDLNIQE